MEGRQPVSHCQGMAIREKVTAETVSERCGKSVDTCHRLLLELADAGVCFVNTIDGKDTFWYDTCLHLPDRATEWRIPARAKAVPQARRQSG